MSTSTKDSGFSTVVLDLVQAAAPGVTVEMAPQGGSVRPPASIPAIRVQQRGSAVRDADGYLSGNVALVLYGHSDHQVDLPALKVALGDSGFVDFDTTTPAAVMPGGVTATMVTATVDRVVPQLPMLDAYSPNARALGLAQSIAQAISRPSLFDPKVGVVMGGSNPDGQTTSITATASNARGTSTTRDGIVRVVIEFNLNMQQTGQRHDGERGSAAAKAASVLSGYRGEFVPSMGRIESTDFTYPTARVTLRHAVAVD